MKSQSKPSEKKPTVITYNGGKIRLTEWGTYQADIHVAGSRKRKQFETLEDARGFIDGAVGESTRIGSEAFSKLTAKQAQDAVEALQVLSKAGVTLSLSGLARLHVEGENRKTVGDNIAAMLERYLADGERKGQRERTIRDKRTRLASFGVLHGARNLGEITKQDVEEWLFSTGAKGRNLRNYQTTIQSFINWCEKTVGGYRNEIADFPQDVTRDIEPAETVTPSQARDVLHAMEARSPEAALALALGCFAGLRSDEIMGKDGLLWEDVDLERGQIIVRAGQAKTRRQRRVEIPPNLRAWLVKYRKDTGRITPRFNAFKRHRQAACEAAGVQWPSNAARHSFGTYYARIHGAHQAAQFMGHVGGIAVFSEHYEGKPVPLKEAQRFFEIEPLPTEGATIIRMAATA